MLVRRKYQGRMWVWPPVDKTYFYSTAALLAMQSAVIPTAISFVRPSVRPFVCPSHAGTLSRRMKIESQGLHCEVAKTPKFSDTNNGWG